MKGNFSRLYFPRVPGQSSVAMQQGRVLLDSDWNTQTQIERRALQLLAEDVIGEAGAPAASAGFALEPLGSLVLDGEQQVLSIPPSPSLPFGNGDFTASIAVIPTQGGTVISRPGKSGFTVTVEPQIVLTGKPGSAEPQPPSAWEVRFVQGDGSALPTKTVMRRNTPLHLAVVGLDGSHLFYVDGEVVGSLTSSPEQLDPRAGPALLLGGAFGDPEGTADEPAAPSAEAEKPSHQGPPQPTDLLSGRLDSFSIWDLALTAEQIQAAAGIRLSGHEEHLVCYFLFSSKDEGETSVPDLSRHKNDGTLSRGATIVVGSFWILPGRYWVAGQLCENPVTVAFTAQPFYPVSANPLEAGGPFRAYLEVWDRFVSPLQYPFIREVALGGPDTTGRIQTVWQLRLAPPEAPLASPTTGTLAARRKDSLVGQVDNLLYRVEIHHRGYPLTTPVPPDLAAKAAEVKSTKQVDPTTLILTLAPPVRPREFVRGQTVLVFSTENTASDTGQRDPAFEQQGKVLDARGNIVTVGGLSLSTDSDETRLKVLPVADYKWSRNNGDLAYPVLTIQPTNTAQGKPGGLVILSGPGYNGLEIAPGDWLELANDRTELLSLPGPFFSVDAFDPSTLEVILAGWTRETSLDSAPFLHPLLRRWDVVRDESGVPAGNPFVPVVLDSWSTLENGIQIFFGGGAAGQAPLFESGDFWTFPVRDVVQGSVEWPGAPLDPLNLPPQGIERQEAVVASLSSSSTGGLTITDERKIFEPLIRPRSPEA